MKQLLSGILLLMCLKVWPQQSRPAIIDSLQKRLTASKNDRQKIAVLAKLIGYYQQTDPKKAFAYEKEALEASLNLRSDSDICNFSGYTGESYMYKSDFKAAQSIFDREYIIAKKNNYKKYMAVAVIDIGTSYELQGDYPKSLNYFFKGMKLAEQAKSIVLETVCTVNICAIYLNEKNFDKTIFYANKVIAALPKLSGHDFQTKVYEFLGSAYIGKNNFEQAKTYYLMALKIHDADKNQYGIAVITSLLSGAYPGNYEKQLQLGLAAQVIFDKIAQNDLYSINNLGGLGAAYGNMAKAKPAGSPAAKALFDKSEQTLNQAIQLATAVNSKQNVMDLSDTVSNIEAAAGKYKDAYAHLVIRNRLYDSIYSQDSKNKIASLEGQHEIELRDKQLQINKLEIANQRKQRLFLTGGLATLFIIAGLIFYQSIQRKKTNTILLNLNTELDEANKVKTRFFSILNHDLRSPVASFVNFLHLQREAPDLMDKTEQAAYSKKATASAENLLNTMEDLLLWSKGQMENFKPSSKRIQIEELFEYILSAIVLPSNIVIRFDQQPEMQIVIDEHYIKTIMYNLTTNAIKALSNTSDGDILWKAWENNGQKYMSVTDNGPGASKEAFKALYDDSAAVGIKSGLGLHIIRDLAKAIDCKISVLTKPGGGAELTLVFPA